MNEREGGKKEGRKAAGKKEEGEEEGERRRKGAHRWQGTQVACTFLLSLTALQLYYHPLMIIVSQKIVL